MNAKELSANIGKIGIFTTKEGLKFQVKILDARQVFNRIDYLIEPERMPNGSSWVESSRVWAPKLEEVKQ